MPTTRAMTRIPAGRVKNDHMRSDSRSDFDRSSSDSRGPLVLSETALGKRKRKGADEPRYQKVLEHERPVWPTNDTLTAEASQQKIQQLEAGNEEEQLMAAFARHVINPGRYRPARSRWVSRRSLSKAFPEHLDRSGFTARSTWKRKKASDFGLPNLFLRSVDDRRAILGPCESIDDLFADSNLAPVVSALTKDEYERLKKRNEPCRRDSCFHDQQGSSFTVDQPPSCAAPEQSVVELWSKDELDVGSDTENVAPVTKRHRSVPSVRSQLRDNSEEIKSPGLVLNGSSQLNSVEDLLSKTEDKKPLPGLVVETSSTISVDGDHTRQHINQGLSAKRKITQEHELKQTKQEQRDRANEQTSKTPVESGDLPVENNTRAIEAIVIPKICSILKDFPTAHEDTSFLPLLRQLVSATRANISQAIEEAHLNFLTHIVAHSASTVPTDRVEITSLVKPVLRILTKHRCVLNADVYTKVQGDINRMCRATNLHGLRAIHAKLLVFEAL